MNVVLPADYRNHSDHNNHSDEITAMAQAITAAHGARFAGFAPQALPENPHPDDAAYSAALQACSQLGFIAIDALCLARAWQRQSARLGGFDPQLWPAHGPDFGLHGRSGAEASPQRPPFPDCPRKLGLYAVLPDAAWVGRMARAGVPTVQLRCKETDPRVIEGEIAAAVAAVEGTGARLFINDHWRAAIAAGAYGVHLGQEDLDALRPDELAALRDSGLRLGLSTHGYAEMLRADAVAPSYIALGAVFPTTLKKMATAPQGVARLAAYAALMQDYPLVAIGGIAEAQFGEILATGVGSIAVVRALVNADAPEAAARQLLARMGH